MNRGYVLDADSGQSERFGRMIQNNLTASKKTPMPWVDCTSMRWLWAQLKQHDRVFSQLDLLALAGNPRLARQQQQASMLWGVRSGSICLSEREMMVY